MSDVFVALETFVAPGEEGRDRLVERGSAVRRGDPVLRGRKHLFEPIDVMLERASAIPGEKRSTRFGKKAKGKAAVDVTVEESDTELDDADVEADAEAEAAGGDVDSETDADADAEASADVADGAVEDSE